MFIVGVRVLRDKRVPWQNIGLFIRYFPYNTKQKKIKDIFGSINPLPQRETF